MRAAASEVEIPLAVERAAPLPTMQLSAPEYHFPSHSLLKHTSSRNRHPQSHRFQGYKIEILDLHICSAVTFNVFTNMYKCVNMANKLFESI